MKNLTVVIAILTVILTMTLSLTVLKSIIFSGSAFPIMVLFGFVAFIPFFIALAKKTFNPFEPIYLWILIYCFLYLANPFIQILNGDAFAAGDKYLNTALLLAIIGLICFYTGYYSNLGKKIASRIPVIKNEIYSKKMFYIAWAFIAIGFLAFHYYVQISGGWLIFWQKPHGSGGLAAKTTAYIYQLPELMIIGFILIYEIFIHKIIVEKKRLKAINVVNLITAGIGGVGIYTILMGSRAYIFWLIITLIILYFLKKQSLPKPKTLLTLILLLFLIINAVPIYRSNIYIGSNFSKFINNISFKKIYINLFNPTNEFNSYLAEVTLVPDSIPYNYFSLYFKTLAHPIPRFIWPNKSTLLNPNWDDFLSKSGVGGGSAETMLGDFYSQLGILSIIIGTFLSGILWKIFYAYLKKTPTNRSVILIYAIILPNMLTYLAQSPLIAFLKWLPYMIPATIIALLLSRGKEKNS